MTANEPQGDIVTAIDVGSSKISVARGQVTSGHIDLFDIATAPSVGIKQGIVTDLQNAANSIGIACAQLKASSMGDIVISFSGRHIHSMDSWGMAAIEREKVSHSDVDRARAAALGAPVSVADTVLGLIEQGFAVDGQDGVLRPVGLAGRRLEMLVHRIHMGSGAVSNLLEATKQVGIGVKELIPQALAASHSVLSEREMKEGVCLLDIGAGTTDVAVFINGMLRKLWTIPVAGNGITSDIANEFHIEFGLADELKRKYGLALAVLVDDYDPIDPEVEAGLPMTRKALAQIIQLSLEGLLIQVVQELDSSGLSRQLFHGMVITGGTANLKGIVELCEEVFHSVARVGVPVCVGSANALAQKPELGAVIGALLGGFPFSSIAIRPS